MRKTLLVLFGLIMFLSAMMITTISVFGPPQISSPIVFTISVWLAFFTSVIGILFTGEFL